MKEFFKYTLATVTGIILTTIVMCLISAITIFGIVASSDTKTKVEKNSIMMLDLNGTLVERNQENLKGVMGKLFSSDYETYGLNDILASIAKAKENSDIKGIYIRANMLASSFASLQEIRNALKDFRSTGKFIVVYSDNYTQGLYYLSSVANKIILNPQGAVQWKGLAVTPMFYKNLLDKIGIEMQVFKVGTYKSATEPFLRDQMSPADREQMTSLLGSLWNEVLASVSESRKISKDSLNTLADRMLMFHPSEECLTSKLVDTLMYRNDVRDYLKKLVKIDKDEDLNILSLEDMINVEKNVPKDKSGNVIAVYYASGEIIDEANFSSSSEDMIVGSKVIRDLRDLKEDDDVKAVVLRVNSPGGSAFASEQIWKAIKDLKTKKPVIVSMGDYAASGGYYISSIANTIIAEPTTLTGSIGIFGMIPNAQGLSNKLGLTFDVVKTNAHSDFGLVMRPLNDSEKTLMQMKITEGYNTFIKRCAEGRKMKPSNIEKIAQGRVWSGVIAKKLGLVDELGGIDKAIALAKKKAGIKECSIIDYPDTQNMFSTILEKKADNYVETKLLQSNMGEYYKGFSFIRNINQKASIQARLPFELIIK